MKHSTFTESSNGVENDARDSKDVPDGFAIDLLKRVFEHEHRASSDKLKRQRDNFHRPFPEGFGHMGGDASTLAGRFIYERGFSTLAWTSQFANFSDNFHYNVTMDLGYCKTSIRTSTDIGTYTFVNGTTTESTRFDDMTNDIRTLVNPLNYSDTEIINDHIANQGLLLLEDINRGLAYIPRFCQLRNQAYLGAVDVSTTPNDENTAINSVKPVHDELRRRLLMVPQHRVAEPEIEEAEDGSAGVAPSSVSAAPDAAASQAPILAGPTTHGYNLYLVLGVIGSVPVGGLGGLINELMWGRNGGNEINWQAVTGGAISLLLAFIYTAYFLGRPLTYGHLNGPGEASAAAISRSKDTIVRPINRQATRVVGGATEGTLLAATLATLRRQARDTERRLSNLEQEATARSLPGTPLDVELSFRGRIAGQFSRGQLEAGLIGSSGTSNPVTPGAVSGTGTSGSEAGAVGTQPGVNEGASTSVAVEEPQRPVCDLEDVALRIAIGRSYVQGESAFEDRELDELPEDELLNLIASQTRDDHGHCESENDGEPNA